MNDYDLFLFFKSKIDPILVANGITNKDENGANIPCVLTQSYQPTSQGAELVTQVFMEKLVDRRFGWPKRTEIWNAGNQNFDKVQTQQMEVDFQVGAFTLLNPGKPSEQVTASDILHIVALGLQDEDLIREMASLDMGILRILEIQNPKFNNDVNDFQDSPFFVFTATYKRATIPTTKPIAVPIEGQTYPV